MGSVDGSMELQQSQGVLELPETVLSHEDSERLCQKSLSLSLKMSTAVSEK